MGFKIALLLLGGLLSTSAIAVNYVNITPLAQIVKGEVGPVKSGDSLTVPIITWGGDIATLHGNGNTAITAKDSIFDRQGFKLRLLRQDNFVQQIESYMKGETPYLRGTLGMLNQAADVLTKDPRTQPVIVYQLTWSAGGDALVVKDGIRTTKDLKGKTIVLQAYGPHVDYLLRVLSDAGLTAKDVNIRWVKDLTGTDNSPMEAFHQADVHAAMTIIPDALALTSGGSVGTGAESSVKGAHILMSTKTANRIIADVYAVRSDYFKSNRPDVERFVRGLMQATEATQNVVKNKGQQAAAYQAMMTGAAKALLDSEQALADTESMYADAEFVGFNGNVQFLSNPDFPRRLEVLNREIQHGLAQLGLVSGQVQFAKADWNFAALQTGLTQTAAQPVQRFDEARVAAVVSGLQRQGALEQGELYRFEVLFAPNQKSFAADFYQEAFDRVIDLASTYGGAVITVEGHSDPMGYLRQQQQNASPLILNQIKQSAKNLSLNRAQEVRDNIVRYAAAKNISLDPSQFAVVGHGISAPKSGICGDLPCAPKNETEWRSNMRVEFRIIQIEAEESAFKPL